MNNKTPIYFLLMIFYVSCSSFNSRTPQSADLLKEDQSFLISSYKLTSLPFQQRIGMQLEDEEVALKSCVIYLQGLGDSIRNHAPFFKYLSDAGHRTLTFDYLGQGGSEGSMNSMRLDSLSDPFPKKKDYEIGYQTKKLWNAFKSFAHPHTKATCENRPRVVIGWSTGGLAAYQLAYEKWGDGHILIAPGIAPKLCVGESKGNCLSNLKTKNIITERTLTRNRFINENNPHLDPISPTSPMKVKEFAINLMATAKRSKLWKINKGQKGLVFLSGKDDSYVDQEILVDVLSKNASHFEQVIYENALHEIDNEVSEVTKDFNERVVRFLNEVSAVKDQ